MTEELGAVVGVFAVGFIRVSGTDLFVVVNMSPALSPPAPPEYAALLAIELERGREGMTEGGYDDTVEEDDCVTPELEPELEPNISR